jgi:ketosteroid isomerase-like protein
MTAPMNALMKTVLVLVGCISLDPVLAQPPNAPLEDSTSVADTIKQREHEWAEAMTVVNLDKLNQIIADDFVDGYPGKITTKAGFLDDVKSGKHKLESYEYGPIDVKVLGNVAVVQGTVTETRSTDGQLHTVHVAFMDVFAKRGGKWVVVRGQGYKL